MKYLVNRETKEHVIPDHSIMEACPPWEIVEADEEGWIKRDGAECPLPANAGCEVKDINSIVKGVSEDFDWSRDGSGWDIVAYRPILPADSKPDIDKMMDDCAERFVDEIGGKPTIEGTWHKIKADYRVDVFTRLAEAVAASESIPALISEINAMLPEGYEVREKAKPEAVTEDMSDWRNWRKGDLVTCINGEGWSLFREGDNYPITSNSKNGLRINGSAVNENVRDFVFHSRPEAK